MFARRNLGDHFVELSFLRIETRDAEFGCSPAAVAKIKTQTPRPNPAANSDCEHAEAERLCCRSMPLRKHLGAFDAAPLPRKSGNSAPMEKIPPPLN
jgi:hypothetical protein